MNKEYLKSYLYGIEVKIVSIITSGVINRRGKSEIMKEVKQLIRGVRLFSDLEKNKLWWWSTRFYKHAIAGAQRKTNIDERSDVLYAVLRSDVPDLEHIKNDIADSVEYRKKHDELIEMIRDQGNRFYYCTVHTNCAAGHLAYQGRVYYKKGVDYTAEEESFIKKNDLLSVDEVVMEPVWLTTRRNCRHRLIPISFSRAQTGDLGSEKTTTEISYEDSQYRAYRDRYKMLVSIKKVFEKNEVSVPVQLKTDVKRTGLLVRAWDQKRKKRERN